MAAIIIHPISGLMSTTGIDRSSADSGWSNSQTSRSKRLILRSMFKRGLASSSLDLSFGIDKSECEIYNDNISVMTDVSSIITADLKSYEQNVTPASKIKHRSSTFITFRERMHDYSPRKKRTKAAVRNRRLRMFGKGRQHFVGFTPRPSRVPSVYGSKNSQGSLTPFEEHNLGNDHPITDSLKASYEELQKSFENVLQVLSPLDDFDAIDLSDNLPIYSPLHELSFEGLNKLRHDLFALPAFQESDDKITVDIDEDSDISCCSLEYKTLTVTPKSERGQVDEHQDMQYSIVASSSDPQTPVLMRELFINDSAEDEQQAEGKARLELITSNSIPTSDSVEQDDLYWNMKQPPTSTLQRARSYLGRMKSALLGSEEESLPIVDVETLSTDSNYTPVPVSVPTIRDSTFLGDLTENIIVGEGIDPVYHPIDYLGMSEGLCDENTPLSIADPRFFEQNLNVNKHPAVHTSPISVVREDISTNSLRFDTFAQVLFYNKSASIRVDKLNRSLQRENQMASSCGPMNQNRFRKNCDLDLRPASEAKSATRRLKFSLMTRLSIGSSVAVHEDHGQDQNLQEPKSILRSKHNKNADQESVRLSECDKVDVGAFLDFFDNAERERMGMAPALDGIREKQLAKYYDDQDCHLAKQIELLDAFCDLS